ncbi:hypothetical protein X777_15753 [Ooceraea biroi]|uniref:Uncharacterized protein n=1 Tax=Ooceraea biroi TaxID=2015173 RepID=A0A026WSZ0_OOCBI|nr:hypothetical protein X777_15753 [Ooceraea biroi]
MTHNCKLLRPLRNFIYGEQVSEKAAGLMIKTANKERMHGSAECYDHNSFRFSFGGTTEFGRLFILLDVFRGGPDCEQRKAGNVCHIYGS